MKRYILTLLAITMNCTGHAKDNTKYFTKQPINAQQIPQLSIQQLSELNYLDQKLDSFDDATKNAWTRNVNVRILIERTELAIQQSSPSTQSIMKQQVTTILKDHGININFTSKNIIQRTDTDYLDSLENFVEDFIDEDKQKITAKRHRAVRPPTKKTLDKISQEKRISGKRRTLNKIKRDALAEAKKAAAEQAKERALDALVQQKNIDEAARRKELIDAASEAVRQRNEAAQEEQRAREAAQKRSFIASPEQDVIHGL